jgi:hypothetical protein
MDRLALGDLDVVGLHAVLDRTGVRMQHLVEKPAVSPGREDLEQRVESEAHVGGDALRDRRPAPQPGRVQVHLDVVGGRQEVVGNRHPTGFASGRQNAVQHRTLRVRQTTLATGLVSFSAVKD